jgi:hypothetical protein
MATVVGITDPFNRSTGPESTGRRAT